MAQPAARATTLEELLAELRAEGNQIIYSSDLLPASLPVSPRQPGDSAYQQVMRELRTHGLTLNRIKARTYVVLRLPESAPAPEAGQPEPMPEVSVYASRYALDAGVAEPRELTLSDIERVPGSHDDALRSLQSLPGVVRTASARPYIRGSLAEDILFRYDGIPLVDPFHFKNFQSLISAIDPAAIDGIEVFSGGFPVRYGTRSGGVIDISAPEMASGREHRASLSLVSAGVSTIGHAQDLPLEWLGAIRQSTLNLLDPVEDGFGNPEFSDSIGRLRWKTARGAWTAGWLLLNDRMELNSGDGEEDAVGRYRDEYLWLARDHRFNESVTMRSSLVLTSAERIRQGRATRPGVTVGSLDELRRFDGFELLSDWNLAASGHSSYSFGGGVAATRARYRYERHSEFSPEVAAVFGRQAIEDRQFAVNPDVITYSLYAANRRRWSRFEAEFGLRVDGQRHEGEQHNTQLSPRLNLRHDLTDTLRLYASVGRFTQAQHVEEWRVEEAQQTPDAAQVANHSIIGLQFAARSGLSWGAELYHKRWAHTSPYFDSRLDPLALLPDLSPDRVRIVPLASEASGLELSLRAPLSAQLSASGTLAWSRVADVFAGSRDVLRSWDQPLSLNAGLAWKGMHTSVSALAGWHRGWPRTSVEFAPLSLGARNSERWPNYFSLDLRASRSWDLGSGEFAVVLDVTNATNRGNPCCLVLTGSGVLRGKQDHWLPFLANIGLTYRWRP